MSRRAKIVIAILVILLLILLAAFFLLRPKPTEPAVNNAPVNTNQPVNGNLPGGGGQSFNLNVSQPTNVPVTLPPVLDDRLSLRNTARSFAELYGSYSSEGNFQNIVDAQYYMSDSVIAWAEQYVAEQRAKPRSAEFSGVTTRVIFEPVIDAFDAELGTATVTVSTRRIETGASIGSNNVYYQDIVLDFIKVGTSWKVNRFTWSPR